MFRAACEGDLSDLHPTEHAQRNTHLEPGAVLFALRGLLSNVHTMLVYKPPLVCAHRAPSFKACTLYLTLPQCEAASPLSIMCRGKKAIIGPREG